MAASKYVIKVCVIGGKDLAVKDRSGTSDPYAIVTIGGKEYRSAVAKKNLNPTWNFSCEGQVNGVDSESVKVVLWDKDMVSSDFMGQVEIPLSSCPAGEVVEKWYTLETNSKGKEVSGEVGVTVKVCPPSNRGGAEAGQADLEDSNVAGIGGEENRALRKQAALTEEAWQGAGSKVGKEIWRIEKFEVKRWPEEEYGNFFQGDSYIILDTRNKKDAEGNPTDALEWDVYFWLGADTTQDEAGTAAYKTVEIDDLLDDGPVQHREVQGHESNNFLSLFQPSINIKQGGVESGFRHVEPESYEPRLMQVKKTDRTTRLLQVALAPESLHHGDVFILDAGLTIYQWEGRDASPFEKQKAADVIAAIVSDRGGKPELGDCESDDFWAFFGGQFEVQDAIHPEEEAPIPEPAMYKLSDESGNVAFSKCDGVDRGNLNSDDVFIVDSGAEVFVYIGKNASFAEKKESMVRAMKYLEDNGRPSYLPITRVLEGGETAAFENVFE